MDHARLGRYLQNFPGQTATPKKVCVSFLAQTPGDKMTCWSWAYQVCLGTTSSSLAHMTVRVGRCGDPFLHIPPNIWNAASPFNACQGKKQKVIGILDLQPCGSSTSNNGSLENMDFQTICPRVLLGIPFWGAVMRAQNIWISWYLKSISGCGSRASSDARLLKHPKHNGWYSQCLCTLKCSQAVPGWHSQCDSFS